jgi:hypothetical protein
MRTFALLIPALALNGCSALADRPDAATLGGAGDPEERRPGVVERRARVLWLEPDSDVVVIAPGYRHVLAVGDLPGGVSPDGRVPHAPPPVAAGQARVADKGLEEDDVWRRHCEGRALTDAERAWIAQREVPPRWREACGPDK